MDESGIWAQVLFPNSIGLGGQGLADSVQDPVLRRLCIEIYNDAMAELQEESGAALPADARAPGVGRRRVRARSRAGRRPRTARREHDLGPAGPRRARPRQPRVGPAVGRVRRPAPPGALPHRLQPHRDELLRELLLAVAARVREAGDRRHDAVHRQRARRGQLDRLRACSTVTPDSSWCRSRAASAGCRSSSRRSTTRCSRTRPSSSRTSLGPPSEYFRDHWYATFWFEKNRGDVQGLIDSVGEDNVLFETDFPHPTCLYPDAARHDGREDGDAAARDPSQGDGRERREALPPRRLTGSMAAHAGPLSGVRVLDLTRFPPGAYCTVLLADLGADVCRVDAPGADPGGFGVGVGLSRGKRSIALDQRHDRGAEVLRRLAGWADVLVENNRPGAMEQRGFGYPQAAVAFPSVDLVLDHRLRSGRPLRRSGPATTSPTPRTPDC